jgi:hypothetical protein
VAALAAAILVRSSIALWVVADAPEQGRTSAYDLGACVFFLPLFAAIMWLCGAAGTRFEPIGWFVVARLAGVFFAWPPVLIVNYLLV